MFSWIKQLVAKPVQPNVPTPEHLKLSVLKKDIPRYPPFMKGLPLETPEDIISVQEELMVQLAQSAKVTKAAFDEHYKSAVYRFASFVHLLPASQAHHHRGAGGLLRHSLEVGLWALREADKMLLLELCKTPGHRREIEPRWLLTAFLAGLCHDIGKPATDVMVRNHASTKQWNPIERSLWEWADREGIDAYFLEWQSGRAKHHVAITGALAKNIITEKTLAWISSESPQLFVWLMETLNGTPGNTNPLYDIVIKADQKSVERDLKSMGAVMAGYDLGVPVERTITDIMRRLIRQGIWSVNEPGAKVWNIDGNIYLVWPTSGQDIATQVHQDGIPGVPRNADSILDMLIERDLAFMDTNGLYRIAPAVLAAKIPDIKLTCIRLRDDTLVSADPIAAVEGKVFTAPQEGAAIPTQPGSPEQKQGQAVVPQLLPASSESSTLTPAPVPTLPVDKPAATKSTTKPGQSTALNSQAAAPRSAPGMQSAPVSGAPQEIIDLETGEITSVEPMDGAHPENTAPTKSPPEGALQSAKATPVPAKSRAPKTAPTMVLDGAVGEALKALAEDLKAGRKAWGEHVVVEDDERVLLMWPDAFSGYGLTPSVIINDLSTKNWCWADQLIPTRKVIEVERDGTVFRAIRLHHDVSEAFLYVAGEPGTATPKRLPPALAPAPAPAAQTAPEISSPPKPAPTPVESRLPVEPKDSNPKAALAKEAQPMRSGVSEKAVEAPQKKAKPNTTAESNNTGGASRETKGAKPSGEASAQTSSAAVTKKPQSKPTMPTDPVLGDGRAAKKPVETESGRFKENATPTPQDVASRKLDLLMVTANRLATPSLESGWKEVHVQVLLAELRIDTGMDYGRPYVFDLAKTQPDMFKLVKRALVYRAA